MRNFVVIHCLLPLICISRIDGLPRYHLQRKLLHQSKCSKMYEASPHFDIEKEVSPSMKDTPQTSNSRINWLGFALLNAVAIIWGSQHVVIKSALADNAYASASLLNFWRFLSSTLLFSPALLKQKGDLAIIKAGIELGIYTFLGFAFQSIGLETTAASRSAFLLYLNVKVVPFLAAVVYQRKISAVTWLSALLALVGTALLSTDGEWLNSGDVWCIGAAVASALYILRLETHAKLGNAAGLNAVAFITVTALCGLWVGGDVITGKLASSNPAAATVTQLLAPIWSNPLPVLYLGAVTTGLCNYLQTLGQRTIPAERAAIIYSMDPVYAAVFAYFLLGETLGARGICGAALIMIGILVSTKYTGNEAQA